MQTLEPKKSNKVSKSISPARSRKRKNRSIDAKKKVDRSIISSKSHSRSVSRGPKKKSATT